MAALPGGRWSFVDRSMSTPFSRDLKCRFKIIVHVEHRAISSGGCVLSWSLHGLLSVIHVETPASS